MGNSKAASAVWLAVLGVALQAGLALAVGARASADPAAASFNWDGETFKTEVDLSSEFNPVIPQQLGGTCHVFSAAGLFEHACFKRTGKRVNVSEGYLFYRHLENQFHGIRFNVKPLQYGVHNRYTSLDGGYPEKALDRLLNDSILSESELSWHDFNGGTNAILGSLERERDALYKKLMDQGYTEKGAADTVTAWTSGQYVTAVQQDLNTWFQKQVKAPMEWDSEGGGYIAHTQDPNLKACVNLGLKRYVISGSEYSTKVAVRLLGRGVPFVCTGEMEWRDKSGKITTQGVHATIIVGYRYKSYLPWKIEYKVRDSNTKHTYWEGQERAHPHCDGGITYLE